MVLEFNRRLSLSDKPDRDVECMIGGEEVQEKSEGTLDRHTLTSRRSAAA